MAVTDDFTGSTLNLNGLPGASASSLNNPTALEWGADGRLYVTQQNGLVFALSVQFGDLDDDSTLEFYVSQAEQITLVQSIPNFNDDGSSSGSTIRQVTGIATGKQYDDQGDEVLIDGKPAVVLYVSSSDSRIGAGGGGGDSGLDTNSGVITRLIQTESGWEATDIVRGLARSEENHAVNGMELLQEFDGDGNLTERLIVANGGNANTGAPSNNFAGQEETAYSAAILEVDLDQIAEIEAADGLKTDNGRAYVYDIPTLDDPTQPGAGDNSDPFGGNDGFNGGKLTADGPVQIYSAGYRNSYDVEVTEDGRVWTYDNGANNGWGGRPAGEDSNGNTDATEAAELSGPPSGYIATNLAINDNDENPSTESQENFNPQNWDQFHEVTRSDDLAGRVLSAGAGGAQTYTWEHPDHGTLQLVYGGHPNPTRAEGARAGLLYSPEAGINNSKLLVSNAPKGEGGLNSDFLEVIDWLTSIGFTPEYLAANVVAVDPGVTYADQFVADYEIPTTPGVYSLVEDPNGPIGLPADIDQVVNALNPIEGDYREAGFTDGAIDTDKGSVNGLAEYTSTIFDEQNNGVQMQGAIIAADLNGGVLHVLGREADGTMLSNTLADGRSVAADKETIGNDIVDGAPLGLASIGDDLAPFNNVEAFRGTIWSAVYKQNGPFIQVLQPGNPDDNPLLAAYAGSEITDPTDQDLDGLDYIFDPFDFSPTNGIPLAAGQQIVLDFNQVNLNFPGTLGDTGLLGAMLDNVTPNTDAQTALDGVAPGDQTPGLFDNSGNLILGANAPILNIKDVQPGTAVGSGNTGRDMLQTGLNLASDVQRVEAVVESVNWVNAYDVGGRLTGMTFSDGTQFNFVRFAYGDIGGGQLGFEFGIETNDVYMGQQIAASQALIDALTDGTDVILDNKVVELQLNIDAVNYTVEASYRIAGEIPWTTVGNTINLPVNGTLRAVLDGTHTVTDGDGTTASSGAGIGIFAEDLATPGNSPEDVFTIDFPNIRINGIGNEIIANTVAAAEGPGTDSVDTVVYEGTETGEINLDGAVENFDGGGSSADYDVTANDLDNDITVGSGANTVATGGGSDTVRGSIDDLDGDTVNDFGESDKIIVTDLTTADVGSLTYDSGSAILQFGSNVLTLDSEALADFDPNDGPATFRFVDGVDGLEISLIPNETLIQAINAGTQSYTFFFDADGNVVSDGDPSVVSSITFEADGGGGAAAQFLTAGSDGGGGSKIFTGTGGSDAVIQAANFGPNALNQLHWNERSSNQDYYGYEIPVENGNYRVDIYLAEIFHGVSNPSLDAGDRVFDIIIEGETVEDNFDLGAALNGAALTEIVLSYDAVVADGAFTIDFDSRPAAGGTDQPKISGLALFQVGGEFIPPADTTAPLIESITVANPVNDQDSPRQMTVILSDNAGFDQSTLDALDGSELLFTGIVPASVSAPAPTLSNNGTTATLVYTLDPPAGGSWPQATLGEVTVAADAYADAAGNTSVEESQVFASTPNLSNLTGKGEVVFAVNVGPTTNSTANLAGDDDNTYGGAISNDPIIGVDLQADDPSWYSPSSKTGSNIDGLLGSTGSNTDLDGSALHTYRDSANGDMTATYPVSNGIYVVELWFAELFWATGGNRQGDYTINGEVLATDFDAFTAAGGPDTQTVLTKTVIVTDGELVVSVNADSGEPGWNAIVVYEALPSETPATISVGDVAAAEGGTAEVVFTRVGDTTEEITVEFTVTPNAPATADDFEAPQTLTATIEAGAISSGPVLIPIVDDEEEEAAETLTVEITNVTGDEDAVIDKGTGIVTIAASDAALQVPSGGTILELDFETPGDPLVEGGFDGLLGGGGAADAAGNPVIVDGELQLNTSNGDLSQDPATASKNDFIKSVDLSDPTLEDIFLTTAFDMPFGSGTPNYIQQGIIIATGDEATQQDPLQFQKLIIGGNGGDAIQVWAQGTAAGTDGVVLVGAMSAAAVANGRSAFTFDDVATVELSLGFNKISDTTSVYVTLFDAQGAILGGVRPTATDGFATLAPVVTPPAVVASIDDGTSVVGVTSTDFPTAQPSFLATWDFLTVTSPQFVEGPDTAGPVVSDLQVGLPGASDGDITVTVIYSDASDVDPASIGVTDVTVEGPSLPGPASSFVFDADTNEAVYTFSAPAGGWINGDYDIATVAGEVADLASPANVSDAAPPVTVNLTILDIDPSDVTPPTAAIDIMLPDSADGDIVVTLTVADDTAIDPTSIEVGDVLLTTPVGVTAGVPVLVFEEQSGVATYTFSAPEGGWLNGDYGASVNAGAVADAAGNTNTDAQAIASSLDLVQAPVPGAVVFAVNAGGGVVDGAAYGLGDADFEADTGGSPNAAVDFSNVTTGPAGNAGNNTNNNGAGEAFTGLTLPDDVFTSERWGDELSYNIDLPNGDYLVELYFAETFLPAAQTSLESRLFDVDIEGQTVLDDYDLFEDGDGIPDNDAGAPLVKIVKTFDATVNDGQLNIVFDSKGEDGADNAKISAIVIRNAVPADTLVSIAGPGEVVENSDGTAQGDDQTLVFTLTVAEPTFTGTLDLTLDVDGQSTVLTDVAFTGGVATYEVTVATDTRWNDSESVSVSLVSVETAGFAVDTDASSAIATVTEDDPADSYDLDGDGPDAPVVVGDFSGDGNAPTQLGTLNEGTTRVVASQQGDSAPGGRDRDYITFEVAEGQVLSQLILENWETSETGTPQAFIAINDDAVITVDPTITGGPVDLLGGLVYNSANVLNPGNSEDGDLLSSSALGAGSTLGVDFRDGSGFTAPLPAGQYTIWLNQGGAVSTATLAIVTEPAPATITLSIADAIDVLESGDVGETGVTFDLSVNDDFTGQLEVTYSVGGVEQAPLLVDFVNGAATLSVLVANDDVDNGTDTVNVVLVSAIDTATEPQTVVIDGLANTATGTVSEDDIINPLDIDDDGTLNKDDPFAFDSTNGDSKVLTPGGEFTQDFNTDTDDPFDTDGGFSGILVNPDFEYPEATADDPYGIRTNESKVTIANGQLSVTSTNADAFPTSGTGADNTLADGYQSAVDVSGTTKFEVHARANSDDWLATATSTGGFEQFGISLGAGGTDDFVKLVISDNGTNAQRVQIAHNNSLVGGGETNYSVGAGNGPAVDLSLVGDIEFRLIVDRAAGANGEVSGQVDFFAASDGSLLLSFPVPAVAILADSSLEKSLDGLNPLTGGDGGLAYGIFVSDWSGGSNEITANYDFLTVRSLDPIPNEAPVSVSLVSIQTLPENTDTTAAIAVATIDLVDDGIAPVVLSLAGDDADLFEIVGDQLLLKAGTALDFETQSSFAVSVVATDDDGFVTSAALGEIVTDSTERTLPAAAPEDLPTEGTDEIDTIEYTGSDPIGSEAEPYALPNAVENFEATGTGTINVKGNDADNEIGVGAGDSDTVDLDGNDNDDITDDGSDVVSGTAAELDGTLVKGFGTGDQLVVEGANENTEIEVTAGSTVISIDIDGDENTDATVTLEEDYTSDEIFGTLVDGNLVITANTAPTVDAGIADQTADEDALFSFVMPSNAFADSDPLTLSATLDDDSALPAWLNFDPNTGTFSGTPLNGDVGILTVKVTATDGVTTPAETIFTLTVNNTNDAPTITGSVDDQTTPFGSEAVIDVASLVSLADEDVGDTPTLQARLQGGAALPTEITFDGTNVTVGATTPAGLYAIELYAFDTQAESVSTVVFNVTVEAPDTAPTLDQGIADQIASEDAAFSFVVPADAFADDGGVENLTLSATLDGGDPLPTWLTFDPDTKTFSGTPVNEDVDVLTVAVSANDGVNAPFTTTFTLTVENTNDAPTVSGAVPAQNAIAGAQTVIDIVALVTVDDVDASDTPTLEARLQNGDPLPLGLVFDGANLTVETGALADTYDIEIYGFDTQAESVQTVLFTLTVAPNIPPVADDESFSTEKDTVLEIAVADLLDGDTDADGGTLAIASVGSATGGTAVLDGDTVIFTPTPDYAGPAGFEYTLVDGQSGSDTGTVTINVTNPIVVTEPDDLPPPTDAEDVVEYTGDEDLDLSDPGYEDLDLSEKDTDGGTIILNSSDNKVDAGTGEVKVILGGGSDEVSGTAEELDGDEFDGFDNNDKIVVENDGDDIFKIVSIEAGSTVINISTDENDETIESQIVLTQTYTPDQIGSEIVDGDLVITVEGTPGAIVFNEENLSSWSNQDKSDEFEINDGGNEITLIGNSWKKLELPAPFTIQSDTELVFTVFTTDPGEILGIALDNNDDWSPNSGEVQPTFQLAGSQPWGSVADLTYNDLVEGVETTYVIPLGQFAGETFTYLGLIADDDKPPVGTNNVTFKNVALRSAVSANTPPTANDDTFTTEGGTPLVILAPELTGNDTDLQNDPLVVSEVSNGLGGTAVLADGAITFTPDDGFSGTASFEYTVDDGKGGLSTATVTVEVNTPPVANPDSFNTDRNKPLFLADIDLTGNDDDADGHSLELVQVLNPVNGTVELEDGQVVFTPTDGFVGTAMFEYVVEDEFNVTSTGTVTVTVAPEQGAGITDIPFVIADIESYAGFQDKDADGFAVSQVGETLTLTGNTWKKMALPEDLVITEDMLLRFTFTSDLIGEIIAIGLDDDDSFTNSTGNAKTLFQIGGTDPNGGFFVQLPDTYTDDDLGQPKEFEISLASLAGRTFKYITFVNDQDAGVNPTNNAIFTNLQLVRTAASNGNPIPVLDELAMEGNTVLEIDPFDLISNDTDPDNNPLSFVSAANGENGTVVEEDGLLYFTPTADFAGEASFTYIVADQFGGEATGTVTIQVNRTPEPANDDFEVLPNQTLFLTAPELLANDTDPDGDSLTVIAVDNAVGGTVGLDDEGLITFIPGLDFVGIAAFEYTVEDVRGGTATATVNVSVGEPAPTDDVEINFLNAVIDSYTSQDFNGDTKVTENSLELDGNLWKRVALEEPFVVTEDSILTFELLTSDNIGEIIAIGLESDDNFNSNIADQAIYQLGGTQSWGRATTEFRTYEPGDGTVLFSIPLANLAGKTFTHLVFINDDDAGGLSSATFSNVVIGNGNREPEFDSDTAAFDVLENTTAVTTVSATDPDNDPITYGIVDELDGASFTIDATSGELAFAQAPDFETPTDGDADNVYQVTVSAFDGEETVTQTIDVTVTDDPEGVVAPVVLKRINAFGAEVAAIDGGPVWEGDLKNDAGTNENENHPNLTLDSTDPAQDRGDAQGYSGSAALPAGVPVSVIGTARSSNAPFSYDFDVAELGGDGEYTVRLYFAELFTGNQVAGDRIFDISVEGVTEGVLDNFDPSASGAPGDITVVSYDVSVTDGTLNIEFAQDALDGNDNPIINAIEIYTNPSQNLDTDAPAASIILSNPAADDAALIVEITLTDESAINETTFGDDDLSVTVLGFAYEDAVTFVGFANGVARYEIAAPELGWINDAPVQVTLNEGAITDTAPVPNGNAETVQSLSLEIGGGSTGGEDVVLLRINAWGDEVAATDSGPNWLADGNGNANIEYVVVGTGPQDDRGDDQGFAGDLGDLPASLPVDVLNTARSSNSPFSYGISVADLAGNGDYTVNLYFAELFGANQSAGNRIFDIFVEGNNDGVLNNFDPSVPAGGGDLSIVSYDVSVTDGTLNIEFAQDAVDGNDNPIINGIEIIGKGSSSVDLDGPLAAISLTNPVDAAAPLTIQVTLTDASGIDANTVGDGDISATVLGFDATSTVNFVDFTNGVATYTIAAPQTGWVNGTPVQVTLNAGAIADTAAVPNVNAETSVPLAVEIGGGSVGGGGTDTIVYRINAFGPEVAASDGGPVWTADGEGAANSPYLVTTDDRGDTFGYSGDAGVIPASVPAAVLDTLRSSDAPFSYSIPTSVLGNGENYEVRLYISELFTGGDVPGGAQAGGFREFDATLEGFTPTAFNDIDPGAQFGADVGVLSAQVKVTDGFLDIGFTQDQLQNPIVNAIEIVALAGEVDDVIDPPADPGDALEILENADGIDTTGASNGIGAAELRIMENSNGVQSSNFGNGSFVLENTGDKDIAAVLIDFRNALYGDSVVDFDGSAGDLAFKEFDIDSGGNTGAYFDNNDAEVYYFQKDDPVPATSGQVNSQTINSAGGWQGLLLKASGSSGGFNSGETVTFSGDMDPNSAAAMAKGPLDSGAVNGWDVGGVSGAELIGSAFTVLFVDGTTATGYLGGNGNQAASIGEAVEGQAAKTATVTVNGIGSDQPGTYGGTVPEIIVSGEAGDVVRVTLSRGLNPVNGVFADEVAARLANSDPAFQVNNAADFQFFDVTIGANGTATLPANAFDWLNPDSGENFAGTAYTNGFDTAPAVVGAAVIDPGSEMPLGATDRVYLTNQGGPVEGGASGGTGSEGYYEGISFGNNGYRFKVQIEDANANGGQNPGGQWSFLDAPDGDGDQAGFQGSGYYLFGSETNTGIVQVQAQNELVYTIFIPDDEVGTYSWRQRVARDGDEAGDAQNDLWLDFRKAGTNESIEDYLIEGANEPEPTSQGSIKVFGGPNTGSWGNATNWDGLPGNPATQLSITEGGLYEVVIHGRSQGYHVDFWELYKGGNPAASAGDSTFFATGDTVPTVVDPIDDLVLLEGTGTTVAAGDAFQDLDGDDLSFLANFGDIPNSQSGIDVDTGLITLGDSIALGTYTITVTASDDDGGSASDTFEVTVSEPGTGGELTVAIASGADDWEQFGGGASGDFELGFNSGQQQWAGLRFTDIDLPDAAVVTNAVIRFTAQGDSSDVASFEISMQDSENAPAFTADTPPVSGSRDYTDSFVWNEGAWTDGEVYDTPNLAGLINEVIGNDGVTDGEFAFLFEGVSGSRVADSFESAGSNQPELLLTYEILPDDPFA